MVVSQSNQLKLILMACVLLFSNTGILRADEASRGCGCGGGSTVASAGRVTVIRSDADFNKRITDKAGLSVVKFYSLTCGPCKKLKKVYADLAKKYGKSVKFYEFDVNRTKSVGEAYAIRSVPQVLFFSGKEVVKTVVGYKSLSELERELKSAFKL